MEQKEIKYPEELEKLYEEALNAFENGNYTKAKVKFEEAIKYHEKHNIPYNIDALKILSHIYLLLNENNKAKYILFLILKQTPNDITQIFKLAVAFAQDEQYQEAIDILKTLIKNIENDSNNEKKEILVSLYNLLGAIYYENKNIKKAKNCFEKALKYNPNSKVVKKNLKFVKNLDNGK